VVTYYRPRLCVARPANVDDVAGVAVLGLSACVKDSLPDRCSALVGRLPCLAVRTDRRFPALGVVVVLHTSWLARARRRALGLLNGRLLDERLRLRCRFWDLGDDSTGMARSSVAAAMSFWLARGGVFGSSTLKSTLMRSLACLPSSRTRSPRAEASPAMEARKSRTTRYSSAIFASSSCACPSCALMSAPPVGEVGARSAPGSGARSLLGPRGFSVTRSCRGRAVDFVTDGNHEALTCRIMTADARGVGVAEPVVRGVEEPPEHHWVRYAGEVPLRIPVRGGGRQLSGGAVVGLVVGGGD
jgi:hypothetical protein